MSSLKRNEQQEPPPPQSTVPDETLTAAPQTPSPTTCRPPIIHSHSSPTDVILRLFMDPPSPSPSPSSKEDLEVSLHSDVLRRSNYFSTLLSDRWQKNCSSGQLFCLNLGVSSSRYKSFDYHLKVLHLFYTNDFAGSIKSVSTALSIIHVALELLFEECVNACVRFIEAVTWTEEEEQMVLDVIPLLRLEESRELRARVCAEKEECSEEMLHGMILAAMNATTDGKWNKDLWQRLLLEKLLREFSSKDFVGRALSRAFSVKLSELKKSLRSFLDAYKVIDASQTTSWTSDCIKLITYWKQMMWLVERVIELRVANDAAVEWSNNASLVAVLLEALSSKVWNFVATDFRFMRFIAFTSSPLNLRLAQSCCLVR
ncbi:hypothetical protein Syun_015685 [Stephania yunnanensis]|uniref:BTB domain-containing protein n=1 Tax=Stephania yunnanensis TaxID=152371 RepID=A0AAP0JMG9_9MAGN